MDSNVLELISGDEIITIDCATGKELLGCVEGDENAYLQGDHLQNPTDETEVEVYGIKKNVSLSDMFSAFGRTLDEICFTEHQILRFYKKHRKWLANHDWTFFLFKVGNQFLVAYIEVHDFSTGRNLFVQRLDLDAMFITENIGRVVVPKAIKKVS